MIAIHKDKVGFAPRWIAYCQNNNIPYKEVCCYDDNIMEQLEDCKALMWHHQQANIKDVITAKRILFAAEHAGLKVFPNFKTGWHFDDKVAQKYLFEALKLPHVPSHVFYDKKEATEFIQNAQFPLVFKLKGGAGSVNVRLIKNKEEGIAIIQKNFGSGYAPVDLKSMIKDRLRIFRNQKSKKAFKSLLIPIYRLFVKSPLQKFMGREGGYLYVQEFIPNNSFDIRVIIVNGKAIGLKRSVRPNDFRASGSGMLEPLEPKNVPINAIKNAFIASDKIESQCLAVDYVFNEDNEPLLVEISYGFLAEGYDKCPGYWDESLNWHLDTNPTKITDEMIIQITKEIGN